MTSTVSMSKGKTRLTPERVQRLEDEAAALLAKARVAFAPRDAGRDEWLEAGRLLHAHVGKRTTAGVRKVDVVLTAARALGVLPQRVHELIRIAVVTESLSGGKGPGRLAYNSLRYFGSIWDSKSGRMKDVDVEESRAIFARAAEEGWAAADVQKAVWGLSKRRKFERRVVTVGGQTYVCNGRQLLGPSTEAAPDGQVPAPSPQEGGLPEEGRPINVYDKHGNVIGQATAAQAGLGRAAHTMASIATASTPKDLASMILSIVRQSLDPALVARLVGEGLPEAAKGREAAPRTFVGFRGDNRSAAYAEDD